MNFKTERQFPNIFTLQKFELLPNTLLISGGTIRNEKEANFQLWDANDFEHLLKSTKLLNIIKLSEEKLGMEDLEIEVEYQAETIGKYDLDLNGKNFMLVSKQTACLASDACGIPQEKQKVNLAEVTAQNSCKPGGGCC